MVTATNGVAVDARDYRLEAFGDLAVEGEVEIFKAALAVVVALFPVDVAADAERALAAAGQHDDADVAVVRCLVHQVLHFLDVVAGEGVQGLGAIEGDRGNVVVNAVQHFGFRHGVLL